MTKRSLALTAAISATIALISIFAFDRSIALAVHNSTFENAAFFAGGEYWLDVASGRQLLGYSHRSLSGFLLGGSLIAIGLIWWLLRRTSYVARGLVFSGSVQLFTIFCASLIKGWMGRLRPNQLIQQGNWEHLWFGGGDSFPSGHNAFYWGLFLPLAYLFPKYRIPLLIIPLFMAFARIDEGYHFLSDVLGSIALAALVTLLAAALFGHWVKPAGKGRA